MTGSGLQRRLGVLLAAGLLVVAGVAAGQERSPTGRHRPPPPPPAAPTPSAGSPSAWSLWLGGGAAMGGDLMRVSTLDGLPAPWSADNGGGFRASRFLASLDPGAAVNLGLGRQLGERWSLRLDATWSRQDIVAEADLAQVGAVYPFDRCQVLGAELGLEARLTTGASYPFGGFGLTVVRLSPDAAADLAQTNLGARLDAGWHQRLDRNLGLRLTLYGAVTGFGAADWEPRADLATQPATAVEASQRLSTWGAMLALVTRL